MCNPIEAIKKRINYTITITCIILKVDSLRISKNVIIVE